MLDPKTKAKWVKALRSGKYRQGKYSLKQVDANGFKYCCLGVAREIEICKPAPLHPSGGRSNCMVSTDFLPFDTQEKLAEMNDIKKGYNFNRIADWIEANL